MNTETDWGGEAHRVTFATEELPSALVLKALTAIGLTAAQAAPIIEPLLLACAESDISTQLRKAHFIAQCGYESDHFKTTEEYASGIAYEGRRDLGNTEPGDGPKFKGHGWIQVTGRTNHLVIGRHFGIKPEDIVAWLQTPDGAARSAGYYWELHGLNDLADKDDIAGVTRKVNGGLNGIVERTFMTDAIKKTFNI